MYGERRFKEKKFVYNLFFVELLKCEKDIKRIEEGKENEEFWKLLGGKKEYASSLKMQESLETNPPRLFVISNARGNFLCLIEI